MLRSKTTRATRLRLAFWKKDDGVAAVEFAFILPILVTLLLGTFEFSEVYNVLRKVDKTTALTSDIVSQYDCLETAELDAILTSTRQLMQPYNIAADKLTVTVWSITSDSSGNVTVDWSRRSDGSSPNSPGDAPPFTVTSNDIPNDSSRIVAQVNYDYDLPINFIMVNSTGGTWSTEKRYFSVPRGQTINQQTVNQQGNCGPQGST